MFELSCSFNETIVQQVFLGRKKNQTKLSDNKDKWILLRRCPAVSKFPLLLAAEINRQFHPTNENVH